MRNLAGDEITVILLASGDPEVRARVQQGLADLPGRCTLRYVSSLDDIAETLLAGDDDVFLIDDRLTGADFSGIGDLAALGSGVPIVVLGETEVPRAIVAAEQAGAADLLDRTHLDAGNLWRAIRHAVRHRRDLRNLRTTKDELIRQLLELQRAMQCLHEQGEEYLEMGERLAAARDHAAVSQQRYRTLTEQSSVGVWQFSPEGATVYMNPAMCAVLELPAPEAAAAQYPEVLLTARGSQAFADARARWLAGEAVTAELEIIGGRSGELRHAVVSGGAITEKGGHVESLLATVVDVTERRRAEQRAQHLAWYDMLTGLPNRAMFRDRLEYTLANAHRVNRQVAVLCLDLDHFKDINDRLGHAAGDELLRQVSDRLQVCVRRADTVARLGGNQFAVIATSLSGADRVTVLANRIIESLLAPYRLEGQEVSTATSIGITLYPTDAKDSDRLLRNAELALYRAKERSRGDFQFYAPEMEAEIRSRKALERDLEQALPRGELFLEYQPQVALETGAPRGVEALLRWRHPEHGLVSPAVFIPIAESTGLIGEIGDWVLQTACAAAQRWREVGLLPLQMAVNLSPVQFGRADVVDRIEAILSDSRLDPAQLELEVTEGMVMEDVPELLQRLHRLRGLGLGLAIDDFGTGYSSLVYLKNFPITKLKIDHSFVRDIIQDASDAAIAQTIVHLARSLGISVVAEGVETEAQRARLLSFGCGQGQGYLFSRPLPEPDVVDWLQRRSDAVGLSVTPEQRRQRAS